jgi:hypothetical protein
MMASYARDRMPARTLRIVNQSKKHRSARVVGAIDATRRALNIQLRDVAQAWGEYVYAVVDDAHAQGFDVVLLDDADQAGDLGYHDLDPQGRPYARVFLDPILENGGTWLRGANSVSVTVSHEVCELVGDPSANHWVENARGALVAAERCDHMNVLRRPFEIAPDGYVIHHTAAGVRDIWGRSYPRWRKASKRKPASRTYLRHKLG